VRGLYDLRIVPKTRNPGVLSLAPEVQVSGPLDDPQFHPLKRTLVTSLGRGLFENALKPVTLLARPFLPDSASNAPVADACQISVTTPDAS